MKSLDWNEMSNLGLIERINREILHPLGLALSRNPETGHSEQVLIAPDGRFDYAPDFKTTVINDEEIRQRIKAQQ